MKRPFFFSRLSPHFVVLLSICLFATRSTSAFAQQKLVIDDFENGAEKWTTNDKTKAGNNPATLVEVLSTGGTPLLAGSKGAGLFTFKAAQGSWASASTRVDGAAWAKIGARSLSFYLNAGGNANGVEVIIRRSAGGREEAFRLPWPVRLDVNRWRKVVIPLSDFKSDADKAALPTRLGGVYLLQFVMRGTWDARFFSIDQLQIEGTGKAIPISSTGGGSTPKPPVRPATGTTNINVDFLRGQGKIRTSVNASVGGSTDAQGSSTFPLNEKVNFRAALRELKVHYIRLDAGQYCEMTDSSRPAFDFTRLQNAVIGARAIGATPLIAVTNPPEWNLDSKGYAYFASQVARAVNERNVGATKTFELACGAGSLSNAQVASFYNAARAAVRRVVRDGRIGGAAVRADRMSTQGAIIRNASGLDFFTVQDFGANSDDATEKALFDAARSTANLRAVAKLLDASRFKNAPLYALSGLNGDRGSDNTPADGRTVQMVAGAWWGVYLGNASRIADQIFHLEASTPEWGLLDEGARAYPAYYTQWLWNTYATVGSTRVSTTTSNADIWALGLNTKTAHNVLLVNTTDEERTAQIAIRGFPVLRSARIRIYDDSRALPRLENLPKSPYQTIKLKAYGAAVVQFIEPPKS